ncbi:hypothetical protein RHGRI_004139 [Rhododendron griersonianum]|uniref:Serine aminopeptidase S33 domain-containing protein n=1 Tax=Rhododendron griersonianum TaxID=479676 RepID=A0AAV6L9B0_9ERIC|nr:hypothetical protein RHGRI_004139 [Rhododendron griersonianum]
MIDQFINFVIRPPRAEYNPDQYLWETDFTLAGRKYKRQDLEAILQLRNQRGHTLRCSHYVPSPFPEDTPLPCVIYCHGNSGCRADGNEAAVVLLPSNITVFTLDFSGSGLSDGDYVSLGWHEKDDLKVVVSYLRSNKQISCIGLWGRSMGAVKVAVQYMRRVIQKKAKFDIMDLNCIKVAPKTFIPALFGHANDDKFVQPRHSDLIFQSYAGDKNMIKFDGDHNSSRPQFYYDSVSIFFFNILHPPQVSSAYSNNLEKYYDLGNLKVTAGMDESLLYEIISGLQTGGTDAASSSSAPPTISTTKSVIELLSDVAPVAGVIDAITNVADTLGGDDPSEPQGKPIVQNEECCSYTSSNRESWGRCSSLGSDDEPSSDCTAAYNHHETTLKVLATPLRNTQREQTNLSQKEATKKQKKTPTDSKKPNRDKFEKLEALSQRLRHCILKRVNHRRNRSS